MDAARNRPPVTPAGAAPAPQSLGGWLAANATSLAVTAVAAFLIVQYLNVLDVLKVALGLGLVVFIHELGHFAAAKWCDVHVETFSVGFGPALPGCKFKYGETTYMVGLIPLGGYVKMVGEGEGDGEAEGDAAEDGPDDNPRSFRNKSVGQRMLIISAGVVMNILLAAVCFIVAYLHGVKERPAVIGRTEAGSAAWQAGLRTGTTLTRIDSKGEPWFGDIQPVVMATRDGETVGLDVVDPKSPGETKTLAVEPLLPADALYPLLGVGPSGSTSLAKSPKKEFKPYRLGSAASRAEPALEGGDRIVGMSDPADPARVTALPAGDVSDGKRLRPDYAEYLRRTVDLRGKPLALEVRRGTGDDSTTVRVTVPPALTLDFGMRMRMGEVVSLQAGSPAVAAGVKARSVDTKTKAVSAGDRLVEVAVTEPDGTRVRYSDAPAEAAPAGTRELPLDPLRLPFQLDQWAARQTRDRAVTLTVLRQVGHKDERVTLQTTWDDAGRYDRVMVTSPDTPQPVWGLGLAYHVKAIVDAVAPDGPAAAAGVRVGDVVTAVRPSYLTKEGEYKTGSWNPVKEHEWAFVFSDLQYADSPTLGLRLGRADGQTAEVEVTTRPDADWPIADRGLLLRDDFQIQQAAGLGEALAMGASRTLRSVKMIYMNLTAMVFGRVSAWTMSGPLTIATVSYSIAGEDVWQFLLFIGLISVNLAVVNFLPIPVLDGGHMMFLIYEKVRGKPAPERVQGVAIFVGLGLILSLMAFVIFLDIRRLIW